LRKPPLLTNFEGSPELRHVTRFARTLKVMYESCTLKLLLNQTLASTSESRFISYPYSQRDWTQQNIPSGQQCQRTCVTRERCRGQSSAQEDRSELGYAEV